MTDLALIRARYAPSTDLASELALAKSDIRELLKHIERLEAELAVERRAKPKSHISPEDAARDAEEVERILAGAGVQSSDGQPAPETDQLKGTKLSATAFYSSPIEEQP